MKYYLGKTDAERKGVKNCEVYLTWEIKNGEFSMEAEVWQSNKRDIIQGGQWVEEVAEMFPHDKKAARMAEVWKRWHLNKMHAGCEHQRALKWEEIRIKPEELPNSRANRDERGIFAIWVYPVEHINGLLCRPCPTCNYKYGSAWLSEELPPQVFREILEWSDQYAETVRSRTV